MTLPKRDANGNELTDARKRQIRDQTRAAVRLGEEALERSRRAG